MFYLFLYFFNTPFLFEHISVASSVNQPRLCFSVPGEDKKANSSIRFHSTPRKESIPEDEVVLRERSFDYKHRYCGHCNTTTDIKEANFFGRFVRLPSRSVCQETVIPTRAHKGLVSKSLYADGAVVFP
jgi:hypothetical protein